MVVVVVVVAAAEVVVVVVVLLRTGEKEDRQCWFYKLDYEFVFLCFFLFFFSHIWIEIL